MVDKFNLNKEYGSKRGSFPTVERKMFELVQTMKTNLETFISMNDDMKKIPSPVCIDLKSRTEKDNRGKNKGRSRKYKMKRSLLGNNRDANDDDKNSRMRNLSNSRNQKKEENEIDALLNVTKREPLTGNNKINHRDQVHTVQQQNGNSRSRSPHFNKNKQNKKLRSPQRSVTPSTRPQDNLDITKQQLPIKSQKPEKEKKINSNPNKLNILQIVKKQIQDKMEEKKICSNNQNRETNVPPTKEKSEMPVINVNIKKKETIPRSKQRDETVSIDKRESFCNCVPSDEELHSCHSEWQFDQSTGIDGLLLPTKDFIEMPFKKRNVQVLENIEAEHGSNIYFTEVKIRNDKAVGAIFNSVKAVDHLAENIFQDVNAKSSKVVEKNKNSKVESQNDLKTEVKKEKKETPIVIRQCPKKYMILTEEVSQQMNTSENNKTDQNSDMQWENIELKISSENTKPTVTTKTIVPDENIIKENQRPVKKKAEPQIIKAKEKQNTDTVKRTVQFLKFDERRIVVTAKRTDNGNFELNKFKNPTLVTKRTKSQYHNMCTVSLASSNQNENLLKQQAILPDELQKIKEEVDRAIAQKKIFSICGGYQTIRRSLIKRGWTEKMRISYRSSNLIRKLNSASLGELVDLLKDKEKGWIAKRIITTKLLANHPVDFFWDFSNDILKKSPIYNNKFPLINRLRTGIFGYSSKSGLCDTAKRAYWYNIPGLSCLNHPRTYNFAHSGDSHDFLEDYKKTAAMSVLKWIIDKSNDKITKLISNGGKIPLSVFEFAVIECKRFIKYWKHKDIDTKFAEASDFEWHQFFEHFYALVHMGEHFKSNDKETVESIVLKSKIVLSKIGKFYPYLDMDGTMNIWILKPCNGCRGIGIHLCRTLEYILTVVKNNQQRKYVIQKYIERPLLIHNTKFDIRQWILISNTNPLTIWIYKDCYIRLSSQTFNIRKLHESIHLTNNAIQSRYRNGNRDPSLPLCNMWDLKQFKKYLELIGHPKVFEEVIYPEMKQNVTCAILANQDRIYKRKNTFELYGSDFMLTEDFKPWLLEINCRPALYASTSVTAKMCPKVLEDTIKIIIDHERNKQPNVSNFELLYKETIHKVPKVDTSTLNFHITPLTKDYFIKPEDIHLSINRNKSKEDNDDADLTIFSLKSEMKKTLERLLDVIKAEKNRRKSLSLKYTNEKLNNEDHSEINTLENALKEVNIFMDLDNVTLPTLHVFPKINSSKELKGGMHLKKSVSDIERGEDDEPCLEELSASSSASTIIVDHQSREQAKCMMSSFLATLESFQRQENEK